MQNDLARRYTPFCDKWKMNESRIRWEGAIIEWPNTQPLLIRFHLQFFTLAQQLDHRSIAIKTGLFFVNWPVFASVIGYIATYIVILIQFDSKAREINGVNNLLQTNPNHTTSLASFANQTVY
ncbi:uncharacterized protein LOC125950668 [Anopheles darlingi]|uniref:uncharacterized protein LOC125950668 n=1 Tax=Anopheles darlingi TaxID=43151 RepID=UPI00210062C8|nr:uncharacterized protein LOC125950668 [Anopheles darlingi]